MNTQPRHHLTAGHYRLFQRQLETFVANDNPNCQGNRAYRLCPFSNVECKKECFESASYSCERYHFYLRTKSRYDKFGAIIK